MDENLAGILGLLIGGAGGYYGGKKRSKREEDRLKMLLGITDEDDTSGEKTTATEEIIDEVTPDESNAMESIEKLIDDFTQQKKNDPRFEAPTPNRTLLEAIGEEGEDLLFGNVDYEDLGKVFPVGNADEDFYIPGMQTTSPASNIINRQIANVGQDQDQMITNLSQTAEDDIFLNPMLSDADQDFFIPPELIAQDNPNIPNFIEYLGGNESLTPKGEELYTNTAESLNKFYNNLLNLPSNIKNFMEYADIFNDGGRVGLANGGLGYSYKNNIFSADPSTGIPAVVDVGGGGGVANDTFMDLYPGLFDDSTEEDIASMPPILPLLTGGGGGGQMMKNENDYSANPDGTIGFQNPAYDGILGDEYKDRPIGDEFTLGTSPFDPKKQGFFDAYGKFVGSDDMPLGTLPGAQFQDFMTDDEGKFDYSKVIPGFGVVKTLDNLLSNILGFKTDTDPDPEQYDKVKDPMKAFKDMESKALDSIEKDLAAEAAEAREKLKSFSKGEGGGKGFGGANVGDHSPGKGTARF